MSKQANTQPAATVTAPTRTTGPIAKLWALWDSVADKAPIPRSMAIDLGVADGHNYWTCRTQAQRWLTARKAA
jgi:hypothetical protein